MKSVIRTLALGALSLVTFAGCETTEKVTTIREVDPSAGIRLGTTDPAIIGTWMLEEGVMFPNMGYEYEVTAFEFAEDGRGYVYFRQWLNGAVCKTKMFCVYDGEKMVIDLSREDRLSYWVTEKRISFPIVVIDEDELSVASADNEIALFSRQTQLPPGAGLLPLPISLAFTGLPDPSYFTDLVPYEGDLLYSGGGGAVYRFSLTNFTATNWTTMSSRLVQARRLVGPDNRFFTHCGCGGTRDAFEQTTSQTLDTISTEDLGSLMTIRGIEWMPETSRLWLHGRRFSDQRGVFLEVNSTVEPDDLVQTYDFHLDINGLTWDGTHFWAVATSVSPTILRIDPSTMDVVQSYEVPDEEIWWYGITYADNDELYLLGADPNNGYEGIIVGSATPVSVPDQEDPS